MRTIPSEVKRCRAEFPESVIHRLITEYLTGRGEVKTLKPII
ncbi:hypothetical protein ABIB18_003640 [Pantoea sp. UYEF8]